MFKKTTLFVSFTLLALSTLPAFAGGGLISLTSNPTGPINASQTYLLTATVQKEDYSVCQNCPIQFFVENLHESKYIISAGSDKTDSEGKASAKFILASNSSANMVVYAQAQLPNTYKSSPYILSFLRTPSPEVAREIPVPREYPVPSGRPITITTFPLTIDKGRPVTGVKGSAKQVFVSWSPVAGAETYGVKLRPADYSNWAIPDSSPTTNTSINLILSTTVDYYVQVEACNTTACVSSKETLVPKDDSAGNTEIKPLLGDKKIEELQAKVAELQSQVAETQKKQGFLETQLSNIVKFLKSLFPFFK